MRMIEHDLTGLICNNTVCSLDHRGVSACQQNVYLRCQREHIALRCVLHTHGPPGRLRSAELNARICRCIPCFAVEHKIAGLKMDGVLEFLRCSLIRTYETGWIGLKINLHF